MADEKVPPTTDPGAIPAQPAATPAIKKSMPLVFGLCAVFLIVGLANLANFSKGGPKDAPNSKLSLRPASPNAQQVRSFQAQQNLQAQKDQEDRIHQTQLADQMAQLQNQQSVPGPESDGAAPMTVAQRKAIYGDSPNAPKKTSNVTQAQAEAKQRQLAREKEHQDALNSDTVAIDFAHPNASGSTTAAAPGQQGANVLAEREEGATHANGEELAATSSGGKAGGPAALQSVSAQRSPSTTTNTDPMARYDFDGYQGRLYRVFEGTVFEGVVTNHIDGGLAGPMIVMLTTDYYSHDHQQLLLPQGTRLIGTVSSVGTAQARKLFVTFDRAICPDGFSVQLNKFIGLDPLGTTGLATNVNNHYLSSFAAAALIGGIGGLAQIGNTGSVLTADAEIRNGISEQTAQESEQILNKFLNRLPVITVKEGSRARIYITQDMLIPSYAEHRVDPAL
jgi:type IV secretory pathway VirB10-like protein